MTRSGLDETLRALAHPDRRMFLKVCQGRSLSAGELVALSSLNNATVSEHLKVLRKTGLLVLERQGKQWRYQTAPIVLHDALVETGIAVGLGVRPAAGEKLRNMNIDEWWPKLVPATREWLVANNGDVIPADLMDEITKAGRFDSTDQLADDENDWIEAVANGESPGV